MNTLYIILNQRKYSQELRGDLISLPSRKLPLYLSLSLSHPGCGKGNWATLYQKWNVNYKVSHNNLLDQLL